MDTNRDIIFGRLFAIANVLGDRVFEKNKRSIHARYIDKFHLKPMKYMVLIHQELMQYADKFKDYELNLFDMFCEYMAVLDTSDFTNDPLNPQYLQSYHSKHHSIHDVVGVSEAAEILGWDKRKVATYISRGSFPEPIQRISAGPIWTRSQIEDYRDSRK